jgi:hypothetical protein
VNLHRVVCRIGGVVAGVMLTACSGGGGAGDDTSRQDSGTGGARGRAAITATPLQQLVEDSSRDPHAVEAMTILGYNDEQKLQRVANGSDFGPIARLYTLRRSRTAAEYARAEGAMVAVLEVDPNGTMGAAYGRLGIGNNNGASPDVYCVFLRRTDNSGQPWMGAVSKADGSQCDPPTFNIVVDSTTPVSHADGDFPDWAVRFTEGTNGFPALAVRCFNAICEIGNPNGGNRPPSSPGRGNVGEVKTWHDNQGLATPKTGRGGGFERGTNMTLTPVLGLAGMSAQFRAPDGAQAASIMVHGPIPTGSKYTNWGLIPNDSTQVWLKTADGTNWFMRMITPTTGNASAWKRIDYHGPHTAGLVPGNARWKWDPADEGVWVACDQGCCEMTGGFEFIVTRSGDTVYTGAGRGRGRGGSP